MIQYISLGVTADDPDLEAYTQLCVPIIQDFLNDPSKYTIRDTGETISREAALPSSDGIILLRVQTTNNGFAFEASHLTESGVCRLRNVGISASVTKGSPAQALLATLFRSMDEECDRQFSTLFNRYLNPTTRDAANVD
jgi:hypothetical protein